MTLRLIKGTKPKKVKPAPQVEYVLEGDPDDLLVVQEHLFREVGDEAQAELLFTVQEIIEDRPGAALLLVGAMKVCMESSHHSQNYKLAMPLLFKLLYGQADARKPVVNALKPIIQEGDVDKVRDLFTYINKNTRTYSGCKEGLGDLIVMALEHKDKDVRSGGYKAMPFALSQAPRFLPYIEADLKKIPIFHHISAYTDEMIEATSHAVLNFHESAQKAFDCIERIKHLTPEGEDGIHRLINSECRDIAASNNCRSLCDVIATQSKPPMAINRRAALLLAQYGETIPVRNYLPKTNSRLIQFDKK